MYDVVIIGAGMSGLAAGIRLAMFGQRVCILERHYAIGGLNSYYRINDRNYDVGLHALTNFAPRGAKQGPLPRLLRQLRLSWDDFELAPQNGSLIVFPGTQLRFNNDPALLASEVERLFPGEHDNYRQLITALLSYDQLQSPAAAASAREMLNSTLRNPLLAEMLLCPVMFYGSATQHDIDWGSFSVLFRAIFLEGLCRPRGGIRLILKHLVQRFKQLGGQLRLRAGVQQITGDDQPPITLTLDDGAEITSREVISSAGWHETLRLLAAAREPVAAAQTSNSVHQSATAAAHQPFDTSETGQMTFLESICTLDCQPRDLGFSDTIIFYNDSPHFNYARPPDLADVTSGILCSPNNYDYAATADGANNASTAKPAQPTEGTIRLTALANYDRWAALSPDEYQSQKLHWHNRMLAAASRFIPNLRQHIVTHDTFTPSTIRRFTGHDHGAVYGAPQKRYDATTPLEHLWVCGADQGYVGIVGTLTSGIHVANKLLRSTGAQPSS